MGLGLVALAVSGLAHAINDPAGNVLGTSYAALMANYPSVIAGNMARTGYAGHVAHNHSQATQSSSACTAVQIVWTPRGTREVSPFEGGWICLVAGVLYDEFISSPFCNGNARCAMTETVSYFTKHVKQLAPTTPIGIIGQWLAVYKLSEWSATALVEMLRMCINTPGCSDTQGVGACDQDPQCINGMAYDMQLEDDYYEASNQPVPPGDYSLAVQEYYDMTYVGDEEYAIGSLFGGYTIVANAYDAGYGYGSWGELSEEAFGGDVSCPIVTPACP